jgi:hypothetical protein
MPEELAETAEAVARGVRVNTLIIIDALAAEIERVLLARGDRLSNAARSTAESCGYLPTTPSRHAEGRRR